VWEKIIKKLLELPPGENIIVPKSILGEIPKGAIRTLGEATFLRQGEDYEILLPFGGRIHIVDMGDLYKIHWDKYSPMIYPLKHLREDSPQWYLIISIIMLLIRQAIYR